MAQDLDTILSDDTFDSRQLFDRLDELDGEDDAIERGRIELILEQLSDNEEMAYGVTFIRDDFFEDYAQEFAEDIGAIDRDAPWPATYIDWAAAAEALQMDYSSIDIDDVTYWYR